MIVNTATLKKFEVGQFVKAEFLAKNGEPVMGKIVEIRDDCTYPVLVQDDVTTYAFLWEEVEAI